MTARPAAEGQQEELQIRQPGITASTPGGATGRRPVRAPSRFARVVAFAALVGAIVLIALLILNNAPSYTVRADFQNASGLVAGNDVLIGAAKVGTVQSIGLTPDGGAEAVLHLDASAGPLPQGTVARIYENSLSGVADHYVALAPGAASGQTIPDGGLIPRQDTYSEVGVDQLFDALDPLTRVGLARIIRGEAAAIQGRARAANEALRYLAPGLASSSQVTAALTRDEPAFDGLVVQGAQALQALASRSAQLSALVANANTSAAAIAGQSQALEQALALLPATLTRSAGTLAGLRTTLNVLSPVVSRSKVAVARLEPFAAGLRSLTSVAIPTVAALSSLIGGPSGTGGLTGLALATPALQRVAAVAFPDLIAAMNGSQQQLDSLREYTPDVAAALADLGQVSAYYDANGHYVRVQPTFFAFGRNGANELTQKFPSDRYQGLQVVHGRCPGGAVQPSPDGSAPEAVPGCTPGSTPPGP